MVVILKIGLIRASLKVAQKRQDPFAQFYFSIDLIVILSTYHHYEV